MNTDKFTKYVRPVGSRGCPPLRDLLRGGARKSPRENRGRRNRRASPNLAGDKFLGLSRILARFQLQWLPTNATDNDQGRAWVWQAHLCGTDVLAVATTGAADRATRPAPGCDPATHPARPRSAPGNRLSGVGEKRRPVHRRIHATKVRQPACEQRGLRFGAKQNSTWRAIAWRPVAGSARPNTRRRSRGRSNRNSRG